LAAIVLGVLYIPFLFAGFTVGMIAFVSAMVILAWLATVPREKRTDDGSWYIMDSDERAEWVFENRRFPTL